jgi:hypothetical protein
MATSKTARASMVQTVGEKKVISDADYIKNLRYDVNNGIHATQEGAKALLRAYDALLPVNDELVTAKAENSKLRGELLKANSCVVELVAEIAKIKEMPNV